MAFLNDTNKGWVQKMVETFALIQKLALSNRADDHAMRAIMAPLDEVLTDARVLDVTASDTAAPMSQAPVFTAGERAASHLADRASLRDLIAALLGQLEAHEVLLAFSDDDGGCWHAVQEDADF